MGKKTTKVLHGVIISAVICLLTAVSCQSAAEDDSGICLPDQEIVSIQINGIKFHDFAGSEKSFDNFKKSLEAARLLEETDIRRSDHYHAVTFTFADQSKETFYFFQCDEADDTWYLEDAEGSIYQDADFIEDYVTVSEVSLSAAIDLSNISDLNSLVQTCSELEKLGVSYSASDLRAAFAIEMQKCSGMFDTADEAVVAARNKLTGRLMQYQYAVEHGYALTEEEFEQRRQEMNDMMQSALNFEELEAAFEAQDTTYDSYRSYMKEYARIMYTTDALSEAVYEEFRQGNDQIRDHVCDDATEYWNFYLMEIVYPEMEDYKNGTLIPLLGEAEAFYNDYLSD